LLSTSLSPKIPLIASIGLELLTTALDCLEPSLQPYNSLSSGLTIGVTASKSLVAKREAIRLKPGNIVDRDEGVLATSIASTTLPSLGIMVRARAEDA
jgi:hypothetical protein